MESRNNFFGGFNELKPLNVGNFKDLFDFLEQMNNKASEDKKEEFHCGCDKTYRDKHAYDNKELESCDKCGHSPYDNETECCDKDTTINDLIRYLNWLPGVEVSEFATNLNTINPCMIFLNCTSLYSMSIIARVFDRRYVGTEQLWHVELHTEDKGVEHMPQFCLYIHSEEAYWNEKEFKSDIYTIVDNICHWTDVSFDGYFKKTAYDVFNDEQLKKNL